MKYNFDHAADRSTDHSVKHHGKAAVENPHILPVWVADMDFEVLPEITKAIHERADLAVYGYTSPWDSYYEAVCQWMERRHDWKIQPEWIVPVPGVVPALKVIIQACTEPGDSVMICSPVYHPFAHSIIQNDRICVDVEMTGNNSDELDLAAMEKAMQDQKISMLIFCSPQNPSGRVWSEEELKAVGDLCRKYDVMMVSDEIHMDFARGRKHTAFLNAIPEMADHTVVCTAPTKTFNLAGLQVSNLVIPDEKIRGKVKERLDLNGLSDPNILGLTACEAAYRYGDQWTDELNGYLEETADAVSVWLKDNLPEIRFHKPEGLYLFWLDCRGLGMNDEELQNFMMQEAEVWMNPGIQFGPKGSRHMRLNAAAPRKTVMEALERIRCAWKKRQEQALHQ